jgi:hypothetical protein
MPQKKKYGGNLKSQRKNQVTQNPLHDQKIMKSIKNAFFTFLLLVSVVKNLTAQHQLIWEKLYGGSKMDLGGSVLQTSDGNWIFTGMSVSSDGDVPQNQGEADFWVFKTDTSGAIIWSKTFGGSNYEYTNGIAENPDGSFWLHGETYSTDGIFSGNKGGNDVFVLKISADGDLIFAKTYGGTGADDASTFAPTADGGLIFAASTWSASGSGDVIFNHGERDCWLVKIDAAGQIEWQKSIGGTDFELQSQISVCKIGGYWLVVTTRSSDGDFPQLDGYSDTWLMRLDDLGNILWKQRLGLPDELTGANNEEDADGNLVMMQFFSPNSLNQLVKISPDGSQIWQKNLVDIFPSNGWSSNFKLADDGGFYFFGSDSLGTNFLSRANSDAQIIWQKQIPSVQPLGILQVLPLPDESVLLTGQVLTDSFLVSLDNQENTHVWVAKLGGTVSTADVFDNAGFQVSPNPISDGQPLQIFVENDFFGKIKIELLGLDGRVLKFFEKEKTARRQLFEIENGFLGGSFFVCVTNEKNKFARLVIRN